jgi:hypothetical protein
MKIRSTVLIGISLTLTGASFAGAQSMPSLPKVLEIQREFIKPGKAGAIHDKSESNFVAAFTKANWPTRYVALNSLSGKSRALYLVGYSSFEAWEKDNKAVEKNATLSGTIDRTAQADGELLDEFDQYVFTYDEDLSYRPNGDLSHARLMEIYVFKVKPGHVSEFRELTQLIIDAHKKAGTSAHWATYEIAYGGDDEFVALSSDKSMAEIDTGFAEDKQFRDALGEDGLKKVHELEQNCIESSDAELFEINPRQSYPPDEWVKADPEFWKPKPAAAPMAKPAPAAKPAQ